MGEMQIETLSTVSAIRPARSCRVSGRDANFRLCAGGLTLAQRR